ncbi:MAG: hypothetical protein AB8H79_24410 [Myxococcota bacterium]
MLMLLAMLCVPAQAAKARAVAVEAVDTDGENVSTAAVILDGEEELRAVDPKDATWESKASYLTDGTVFPFVRGSKVAGWVVAPGFEPTRFSVMVTGRVNKLTVRLPAMNLQASSVQLPNSQGARAMKVALTEASKALESSDRRRVKARLNDAENARETLEGPDYVRASVALYELRTLYALGAWDERQRLAHKAPSDEVERAARISRDLTGDLAEQWLAYAREAGAPTERASAVCLLATGRPSRCD